MYNDVHQNMNILLAFILQKNRVYFDIVCNNSCQMIESCLFVLSIIVFKVAAELLKYILLIIFGKIKTFSSMLWINVQKMFSYFYSSLISICLYLHCVPEILIIMRVFVLVQNGASHL